MQLSAMPRPILPRARALVAVAWGYLAAVTLVAIAMWGAGDVWWPATVLLFAPRWVFLLPLPVLLLAALLLRRARLPLVLAALVTLGPVMGVHTGWRRALPRGDGPRLRVVTLNAGGDGNLAAALPALLDVWKADVVALQECTGALAARTRTVAGWAHHDEWGLCLLSRFPIRAVAGDSEALARAKREEAEEAGGAGYVVRYTIDTPAGPADVVNLHLETPRRGLRALERGDVEGMRRNGAVRSHQSANARRWASGGRAPLIVAGDFNATVESRIFRRDWGDLADAFSRAGVGVGATRSEGWVHVRIDHVLLGGGWRADRAVVGPDVGSDHRPLIVDLRRRGGFRLWALGSRL